MLRTRKGQPPAVSVLLVGDAGERTMTLLVGHHSLNLDAPWGAWHLLQREAVEVDAQVTLLEEAVAGPLEALSLKRKRACADEAAPLKNKKTVHWRVELAEWKENSESED